MPGTVENHYATLLADHYDWMFGVSFETKVMEQTVLLKEILGPITGHPVALDLGCGSGFQSVALADLGYSVVAVDMCDKLLDGLQRRSGVRDITVTCADIRQLGRIASPSCVDVVVCMGDTITHLSSRTEVVNLLRDAAHVLRPNGSLILTYRDLSAAPKDGPGRFIFVHGDADCVMTCFLESGTSDTVNVTDLIHSRGVDQRWTLQASDYPKLKLPRARLEDQLRELGFCLTVSREARMKIVAAKKSTEIKGDRSP